jgi:hypothetical protein
MDGTFTQSGDKWENVKSLISQAIAQFVANQ